MPAPLHVAIIMDGNGRWATRRGLPRSAGHRAGVLAVRRVVEAAPDLGVATLTLFAFSSDNWRRPRDEVSALMSLLRHYLRAELRAPGRERRAPHGHRPPRPAARRLERGHRRGRAGVGVRRRGSICGSPSTTPSRDAIAEAAARWRGEHAPSRDAFGRLLAWPDCATGSRRRSADPLRRRKAAVRFPAVGIGLRRALLRRHPVARFRRRRSARRDRRFPSSRAALRRPRRASRRWSRRNEHVTLTTFS